MKIAEKQIRPASARYFTRGPPCSRCEMCQGANNGWSARESEPTSRSNDRLEAQRHAALPRDVVLRLVEAVPVEVVHEVPALGADANLAKAILEPSAEIAGELGPGVGGVELMHADRADAAEQVGAERARGAVNRIAQHQIRVVGELVELAASRERSALDAVLRPAAARADADVVGEPAGRIERRRPPESPIGRADVV